MRMIRLLYVEAVEGRQKKKNAGRLHASEGGEDFLLDVVSAECTISLPPFSSAAQTHILLHVSVQMFCKYPSGLKTLERC